jgi:protein-disulfide isomerase
VRRQHQSFQLAALRALTTLRNMSILRPPVGARDHIDGLVRAPITLVEYGDFECPACGGAYYAVKALQRALGPRLRFVFRHFPLVGIHPHALIAAEAAEAAAAQDRFWPMHDLLFENQGALRWGDLLEYAERLGLDGAEFAHDVRSRRFSERVRADLRSGGLTGVRATPTFCINDVRHDGGWDFDSLVRAIDGAYEMSHTT